jgi:hypothetical protein
MVFISRTASDAEIIETIIPWIDALAREEYESVFENLGYAMAYQFDLSGPDCIRHMITSYRSQLLFPNETSFKVSQWENADGGNESPAKIVTRYKQNSINIIGSCTIDLPVNGRWSDLSAQFVWMESKNSDEGCILALEDLNFPEQYDENE